MFLSTKVSFGTVKVPLVGFMCVPL